MVKMTLFALLALTTAVDARPPPPPDEYIDEAEPTGDEEPPAFNLLGFRFSAGALPIDGAKTTTLSIGIGVEHPVFRNTRVFGEYEWLWLIRQDERAMDTTSRPERHASGHRASLGLRRELAGKKLGRAVRMFMDAELGGSFALANDNMAGVQMLPGVFGGLRVGYDVYTRNDESPSRTFEAELLVRAIAVADGIGVMSGLGFAWGN